MCSSPCRKSLASLTLTLVALASLLLCLSGFSRPAPVAAVETPAQPLPAAPETTLVADIPYRTVGGTELKMDLARPARGDGPFPAVLVLNGGCWMDIGGDRKFCRPLLLRLAERGYVAVASTHRSAATTRFPAQLHDARAAVRWFRTNATAHRIDPERVAAVGFSSGGHLACLLGSLTATDGLDELEAGPAVSGRVQVVVACYAPTDLSRLRQKAAKGKPTWFLAKTALGVFDKLLPDEQGTDWAVKASPVTYVRRQSVPTLLVHGSADAVVPCEQSEVYAQKLTAAGTPVRLLKLDGAKHGFGSGFGEEAGKQSDDATLEFLDHHFQPRVGRK